jgi:hypothetical protein
VAGADAPLASGYGPARPPSIYDSPERAEDIEIANRMGRGMEAVVHGPSVLINGETPTLIRPQGGSHEAVGESIRSGTARSPLRAAAVRRPAAILTNVARCVHRTRATAARHLARWTRLMTVRCAITGRHSTRRSSSPSCARSATRGRPRARRREQTWHRLSDEHEAHHLGASDACSGSAWSRRACRDDRRASARPNVERTRALEPRRALE